MKKPKYDYFDVVRLKPDIPELPHLAGMLGVVIGMTAGEESEREYVIWFYGFDDTYSCLESELNSTGFRDRVDDRWFDQ